MCSSCLGEGLQVKATLKGKSVTLPAGSVKTGTTTMAKLEDLIRQSFGLPGKDAMSLKLLHKGKVLSSTTTPDAIAFPSPTTATKKKDSIVKIMVLATPLKSVQTLNSMKSDPTLRGLDEETARDNRRSLAVLQAQKHQKPSDTKTHPWGPTMTQHTEYKFCRFEACTWQSFGHRAARTETPHAFRAMELLDKLATDPGVVAIMKERELVVGTLGEMDPVDDRIMQRTEKHGGCLLGYNTNGGMRIDVKLRTDDLKGFRPYRELVATLIHELSHNWVGEHNLLFWSNYGQMRVEYLHTHATLASTGYVINGQTSAEVAGISSSYNGQTQSQTMKTIFDTVMQELKQETARHGVPMEMVMPAVIQRGRELLEKQKEVVGEARGGQKVGGGGGVNAGNGGDVVMGEGASPRELALAAAERRAREQQKRHEHK